MNGSKLLLIGVLLGFGGGMTAAITMKVVRSRGNAIAHATPAPVPQESAIPAGEPEPTPYDLSAPLPPAVPEEAVPETRPDARPGVRPGGTRVAAIPRRTPEPSDDDVIAEMPVEGPPAQLVFGKAGAGTAITRVTEERHNDSSIVRVELTGKARYKILQLPKRKELWIDFEEVEVPGGEKAASGSKVHVEELRARTFDDGAIARVTVRLANEGQFPVFPSKGTGEADGMLEIMLGP